MKIRDVLFYRSWCAACVEGRGIGGQHRIELEEDERERTTPIVVCCD